jgi:hypothetical protein
MKIPMLISPHFGKLLAPENFTELSAVLSNIEHDYVAPEYWRGQADIEWKVESTAVRRINRFLGLYPDTPELTKYDSLEQRVRQYEQRLINDARNKGFGYKDGRRLSDLELLASLQHYGAATRLVDFTRNVFIALWFACQSQHDKYGLLLGSDVVVGDSLVLIRDQGVINLSIEDVLEHFDKQVLIWEPQHLFERMRVQQSIFFLSMSHDGPWGSLTNRPFVATDDQDSNTFFAIAISPELKKAMANQWRILLGYDVSTLFPDFAGFGRHHSSRTDFELDYFATPLE